jgi:hypothetical protein
MGKQKTGTGIGRDTQEVNSDAALEKNGSLKVHKRNIGTVDIRHSIQVQTICTPVFQITDETYLYQCCGTGAGAGTGTVSF